MNPIQFTGYFADCYVLAPERTAGFVASFLNHFGPNHRESADEYELDYPGQPAPLTFVNIAACIDFLIINPAIPYTLYWKNNDESDIRFANCFFTDDGFLIVGLGCECEAHPVTAIEDRVFGQLQTFCRHAPGYITYESPAPSNSIAFLEIAKRTAR